jgi:hypothetical protein
MPSVPAPPERVDYIRPDAQSMNLSTVPVPPPAAGETTDGPPDVIVGTTGRCPVRRPARLR